MVVDIEERTILKGVIGLLFAGIVWLITTVNSNQKEISLIQQRLRDVDARGTLQWGKLDNYQDRLWKHQVDLEVMKQQIHRE